MCAYPFLLQWVFKWRLQAEEGMRASGKSGMSDDQIADFVDRFMPAYKAYLPTLYAKVRVGEIHPRVAKDTGTELA